MPRSVSVAEKMEAINMMFAKNPDGGYMFGQRDIERETGLSRPYIRKLAKQSGHQFPRNGIEVKGQLCMCVNCGTIFRKSLSRVTRAKHQFCEEECKKAYQKGINHPSWRTGASTASFSTWVKNQSGYKLFREKVLENADYKCEISGLTEQLEAHHILPKQELYHPEKSFDPENGMCISKPIHTKIHQLISQGYGFEEAIEKLKQEYKNVQTV